VSEVVPGAQGVRVVGASGGLLLAEEDLILGQGLLVVLALGQELGVLVSGDDDLLPVNAHFFLAGRVCNACRVRGNVTLSGLAIQSRVCWIGRGRVPARDQHPQTQHDVLTAAGCQQVFTDTAADAD
jgi:hypothetical protein